MSRLAGQLTDALRELCPPTIHVGARLLDDASVADLFPDERAAIARAGPARRREFAAGRALLRELVPGLGAVGVLATRAPDLPSDLRASLAHDDEVALAVVASAADGIAALGVDVERHPTFSPAEASVVCRPDEAHLDPGSAFVLKEAAYKAWANGGGELLEFHEVRLDVGDDAFVADVRDGTARLAGRYASVAGRWVAVVVVVA